MYYEIYIYILQFLYYYNLYKQFKQTKNKNELLCLWSSNSLIQ